MFKLRKVNIQIDMHNRAFIASISSSCYHRAVSVHQVGVRGEPLHAALTAPLGRATPCSARHAALHATHLIQPASIRRGWVEYSGEPTLWLLPVNQI